MQNAQGFRSRIQSSVDLTPSKYFSSQFASRGRILGSASETLLSEEQPLEKAKLFYFRYQTSNMSYG